MAIFKETTTTVFRVESFDSTEYVKAIAQEKTIFNPILFDNRQWRYEASYLKSEPEIALLYSKQDYNDFIIIHTDEELLIYVPKD